MLQLRGFASKIAADAMRAKKAAIAKQKLTLQPAVECQESIANPKLLWKCVANNIVSVISADGGRLLSAFTSGQLGYRNTHKVSEKAALSVADEVKRRLVALGAESVRLELRGFNPMRNTLIYQLRRSGIPISAIMDSTGIPFNGCRPKKARRL